MLHFGNFMEYNVAVDTVCANVTGGDLAIKTTTESFSTCLFTLSKDAKDLFEGNSIICNKTAHYFQCWDNMKADILSKCGKDKRGMLPILYGITLSSFCGNDSGAKQIEEMKKAVKEIQPDDESKCPESTGIHWQENCKDIIPNFTSSDVCKRHQAIDKCVEKITCDNISLSKVVRQQYKDIRPLLQCKS
ncbi:unnamed protein product [Orchesella dallaii]